MEMAMAKAPPTPPSKSNTKQEQHKATCIKYQATAIPGDGKQWQHQATAIQ